VVGTMAMDTIIGVGTIVATAITGRIIDPLTIIRLAIGALIIVQLLCSCLDSGSVDVCDRRPPSLRVADLNKAKNCWHFLAPINSPMRQFGELGCGRSHHERLTR
jgi:hypothetical protein